MNKTLLELISDEKKFELALQESSGEITPILEALSKDIMENLPKKIDAYKFKIDRMELEIQGFESLIVELQKAKRIRQQIIDHVKDQAKFAMQSNDITELHGNFTRMKLVATSGKTVIEDESKVPDRFKVVETKVVIKKDELKKEIANGTEVPGVRVEPGTSLRFFTSKRGIE